MKENVIETKSLEFAISLIELYKDLLNSNEFILSKQLFRAGTSIGANVQEAHFAQSKKDFINKMHIAAKEARETKYWLILLDKSRFTKKGLNKYFESIDEISRILRAILHTSKGKQKQEQK